MVIAGFKESSRYITKASCGWRIGRGNHSYSSARGDLRMETWCRSSRARRTGRKERIPATITRDRPSRSSASETHPWHRFPRGVDSILLRRSPPSPANKAHSHVLPIVQKANIRELMERICHSVIWTRYETVDSRKLHRLRREGHPIGRG